MFCLSYHKKKKKIKSLLNDNILVLIEKKIIFEFIFNNIFLLKMTMERAQINIVKPNNVLRFIWSNLTTHSTLLCEVEDEVEVRNYF